jgi:hypothetical protein
MYDEPEGSREVEGDSSSHGELLCSLNCPSTVSGMLYILLCLSAEKSSKSDLKMH